MSRRPTLRPTLAVARVFVRRAVRRALATPGRTAFQVLVLLVPLAFFVGPFGDHAGAMTAGRSLSGNASTDLPVSVPSVVRGLYTVLWLFFAAGTAANVEADVDDVDGGDLLVLGAGLRATMLGETLASNARRLTVFGIWFVVGVGLLAVGAGGLSALPIGAVGFVLLVVSAATVGDAVGLFVHRVARDHDLSTGRMGLGIAVALWAVATVAAEHGALVLRVARGFPTAWFAEWALLDMPGASADPVRALAGVAFGVAVTVVAFLAKERLAADLWFRGANHPPEDDPDADAGDLLARFQRLARRVVGGPASAMGRTVLARRVREPALLTMAGSLGFLLVLNAFETGLSASFVVETLTYVVVAGPLVFALNPLADQGPALPGLLRTRLSGRAFVAGHALPSLALGWPVVAVVAAVTVAAGVASPAFVAVAVLAFPALSLGASGAAAGVGSLLPRTDALGVVESEGLGAPGRYAVGGYALTEVVALAPLLAGGLLTDGPTGLLVGVVGSLALALVTGAVGWRFAARRFEGFTLG